MPDAAIAWPSAPAGRDDTHTRMFGIDREDVAAIDAWVESIAARWGESERTVFRARLCIAELAANVIEHGIPQSGDDNIAVGLRRTRDGIEIEFADSRAPFDPTGKTGPGQPAGLDASLDAILPGGRGLMLINAYATHFTYRRDGIYNRTTLRIARH
jgi:anti-sigma regulatory factor (Ser/Thr protein kinase)